jgi:PAS domain S-box-containing protein
MDPSSPEAVALYKGLVDTAFDAIVIHQDGIVRFVNRAFVDMSGYALEQIIGQPVMLFVAPDHRNAVARQTETTDEARYEAAGVDRDGRRIHVDICARSCMYMGRPARVTAIRNISARKNAEEALRRSELRFRELIEHTPDMVAVHREGRIVYANPAFVSAVGCARLDEVLGLLIRDMCHPDDLAALVERIRRVEETGKPAPLASFRVVRADGSGAVVEVASVPIEFDGAPAILAMGRDITDRKQLEAALVQADLMASLGTLTAGIAHEINNPLSYALVNLGVIERKLAEASAALAGVEGADRGALLDVQRQLAALTPHLDDAREGVQRVAHVAHDFKAFSRADSDTREPLDVTSVLDGAIKMTSNEVRHRARLVKTYGPVPLVSANRARLGQVFLNVLVNALQALPEDIETSTIVVRAFASPSGSAIVEVEDNGGGIPADVAARVFDPFFTTKPIGVGTGLGLSISRSIVRSVGGEITLTSSAGSTVCRITLPPAEETSAPAVDAAVAVAQATTRARLLIVDDEPAILRALSAELASDFAVVTAKNGHEALALLKREPFDLVLCDLMMPGTSGIDLHEELSRTQPALATRVVYMTGGAFTSRARAFLEQTRSRCVEKPFALDQIRHALEDALSPSSR